MPINFPTSLDSLTNPVSTDLLNAVTVPHATQHANLNDIVEALEAKVGIDGSAVTTSLDYRVTALEGGSGSVAFDNVTSGANTTATMIIGSGASMDYAGSGTNNASSLEGGTWAEPGYIGATTPNNADFNAINVTSIAGNGSSLTGVNASQLLGQTWANPGVIGSGTAYNATFDSLSCDRLTSTVATGTPPFFVNSTTKVDFLYVARSALADSVTTNANLTGPITSVGNATSVASQTGSGTTFVMDTSPTLVTPAIGAATATSINKVAITSPATSATLTIADGKTFTASNTLTLAGTNGTTITFQGTDTYVGRTTTDTLTNKTLTSPTLTTPTLGVASATTINKVTITAPASGSTLTIDDGFTLHATGNVTALSGSHTGTSSGTNTGDQTSVSGNAGTATALQTARAIYGNNFDGTAALTQVIASTYGGTGNGFAKLSGPATSEKTFTLPNASATILTDNAAVTVPQGGSGATTLTGILKGNGTSAFTAVTAPTGTIVGTSDTQTLTNKWVQPRTGTTTSSATPTINTDNVDFYSLTAQAADITSFTTNLSGTPVEAQKLWISITGTAARAITWGASFEASTVALPTTTVSTNRLDVGFIWNTATTKWRCVATA